MKTIPLTQGKVAVVDDEDFELLSQHKWTAQLTRGAWYAMRGVWTGTKVRRVYMARVIMGEPAGCDVDHRNGDGLLNTRENLRVVSRSQNCQNRRFSRNLKRGLFKGITLRNTGKWMAQIRVPVEGERGRVKNLGSFADPVAAARAYDAAARLYFGEFAAANFPA